MIFFFLSSQKTLVELVKNLLNLYYKRLWIVIYFSSTENSAK